MGTEYSGVRRADSFLLVITLFEKAVLRRRREFCAVSRETSYEEAIVSIVVFLTAFKKVPLQEKVAKGLFELSMLLFSSLVLSSVCWARHELCAGSRRAALYVGRQPVQRH